jgi:flagellar motor switch protein FliN
VAQSFSASAVAFFDHLTRGLEEALTGSHGERITISWLPSEARSLDLIWWSCGVSVDAACRLYAGASSETWEVLGANPADNNFSVLAQAVEQAIQKRFGSQASCEDNGVQEEPAQEWTGAELSVASSSNSYPALTIVMNPELLAAVGGAGQVPAKFGAQNLNSADLLMHVEIPVSVSLGRTQIRMKDLLALAHGSIVELDQQLNDDVEIRVNNCVIAHGEVVAVDGNYGVRILRMASEHQGSAKGQTTKGKQ